MLDKIRAFASPTRRNEEGASAVEYGLLVALIAAVVVVAVFALGSLVRSTFHNTCQGIVDSGTPAASQQNCAQ